MNFRDEQQPLLYDYAPLKPWLERANKSLEDIGYALF